MLALIIALWVGFITVSYVVVVTRGGRYESKASSDLEVKGKEIPLERFLGGVLIYLMGALSLASWVYFMLQGWESFLTHWAFFLPHVLLQLAASLLMLLAGHAVMRAWKRQRLVFYGSLGFTVLVSLFSLAAHGAQAHRVDMHVFSTVVQLVGSLFAALIFLLPDVFPGSGEDPREEGYRA